MLNKTTQYGLQVLAYLGQHPGVKIKGKDLAKATDIPWDYLEKVLRLLRKNNFVTAQKGWDGGFELRQNALKRPIIDVVKALQSKSGKKGGLSTCLFGWGECRDDNPCPLHDRWKDIVKLNQELLETTTIGMMAEHIIKSSKS